MLLWRNRRPDVAADSRQDVAIRGLWGLDLLPPRARRGTREPRTLLCPRSSAFPAAIAPGGAVGQKTIGIFLDRWLDPA